MNTAGVRLAGGALALAAAVATAGCSGGSPVGVSNGAVSVCYRAIPVGREVVRDRGARLIGIHHSTVDRVRSHLPQTVGSELPAEDDTTVCVMAFRGAFSAGQVEAAPSSQKGGYALVLVDARTLKLVASEVLDRLPRAFGGRTV